MPGIFCGGVGRIFHEEYWTVEYRKFLWRAMREPRQRVRGGCKTRPTDPGLKVVELPERGLYFAKL